ncbi:sensor histidine kinase, partial [Deinococcus sp. MIMF12]|nr:sensor histidine kinase [Deinococcus rhizophilus]
MTSLLPVVFVVSPGARSAADLAAALPGVEVVHVPGAEALLREAHVRPPAAALLYDRTPGVPLAEVLPLLRQRAELAGTYWLAVGQAGLGALLA